MTTAQQIQADLVMAYRLSYYCDAISLVDDFAYTELEDQARVFAPAGHPLHRPGSDRREDYSPAIRALALYLQFTFAARKTAPAGAGQRTMEFEA